jgi:hypothetical protein
MDIPSNMPFGTNGIKQIDFIIGLQKKFNLVIYPNKTKSNEFIIESFNNWYNAGRRWDFNKYINLDDKIEVIPANNLAVNQLNFGDTLDQDYISQQFSKAANREYSKIYYTDTTNFFSQGKFDVKTTFASTPLVRIPGTGLSGSVGGINPQPTCGIYEIGPVNSDGYVYWINCDGSFDTTYVSYGITAYIGCARIGTVTGDGPVTFITSCA